MSKHNLAWVWAGGAMGSLVRLVVLKDWALLADTSKIVVLNGVGSLIAGLFLGLGSRHLLKEGSGVAGFTVVGFVVVGFCGGLTTFATFTTDVAQRLIDENFLQAAALTLVTITAALVGAAVGSRIGRTNLARLAEADPS